MLNIKKFVVPVLVIIVILAAAVWYITTQKNTGPSSNPAAENQPKFDPKNPNFVMGNVVSATEAGIEFQSGLKSLTAQISPQTKLIKQVKDPKLTITTVPATISDFKAKAQIVVYFSVDTVNNTYKADKIQIISQ